MSYEPRPGTVAFRALAHMELLHNGSEISSAMLASGIQCHTSDLMAAMVAPLRAGIIFRRQKGGHTRSPVFWSLVDHNEPKGAAGAARRPERAKETTQVGAAQNGAGEDAKRDGGPVAPRGLDAPQPEASTEAAQVDGKESSEDHAQQRSRTDDAPSPAIARAMKAKQLRTPTRVPEKINISPAPMRVALWSDGTLEVRREPDDLVLFTKSEARAIVDYLNAIDIKLVDEETAA